MDGFADIHELLTIDPSGASLEENSTFENFTLRTSIVSSGIVLEEISLNLVESATVTIDATSCGSDFTGTVSLTLNGTIQLHQDANADGDVTDSVDTDTIATLTNYTANGEAAGSTDPNCNISFTEVTVTTSGSVSFTDNNNPGESFSISSPASDPLVINVREETGGTSYSIDGALTVSVNEPCIAEDTLTFRLTTTVRIFIPDFSDCPTAGQLMVMLNGTEITVIHTDTGGVIVRSGDAEETFDSCEDIDVCRSSG